MSEDIYELVNEVISIKKLDGAETFKKAALVYTDAT